MYLIFTKLLGQVALGSDLGESLMMMTGMNLLLIPILIKYTMKNLSSVETSTNHGIVIYSAPNFELIKQKLDKHKGTQLR